MINIKLTTTYTFLNNSAIATCSLTCCLTSQRQKNITQQCWQMLLFYFRIMRIHEHFSFKNNAHYHNTDRCSIHSCCIAGIGNDERNAHYHNTDRSSIHSCCISGIGNEVRVLVRLLGRSKLNGKTHWHFIEVNIAFGKGHSEYVDPSLGAKFYRESIISTVCSNFSWNRSSSMFKFL